MLLITSKMRSSIRFITHSNAITPVRFVLFCFLSIILFGYLSTLDVPIYSFMNDENLEELRAKVVYSNSGLFVVLMKHIVLGLWPCVASYYMVKNNRSVLHWILLLFGLIAVLFIGRKSSLVMFVIYTFFLYYIYHKKILSLKKLVSLFGIGVLLIVPFYLKYGFTDISHILSLIALRTGVLESASSYIQYEMFYESSPNLKYLNIPFINLIYGEFIDVRLEAYSSIYTNKGVGNMQGLGLLILVLSVGNWAYIIFPLLVFIFFLTSRYLTDSLKESNHSFGLWILAYSMMDIGFSFVGINIFSFVSSTILEPRLLIVFILVYAMFNFRVLRCT